MKKVLLAIAALSLVVVSLAGCPATGTSGENSSTGNGGSTSQSK